MGPNLRFEEFVPISLGEPLQNLGSYMEVTYEGSGENEFFYEESNDDVMIKVTNNMDGNCDAKVMICMWCPDGHEMEEWGLDTLEGWKHFEEIAATASFNSLMDGIGHCFPVLDPLNTSQPIHLSDIDIPCDSRMYFHSEGFCGIVTYIDPMDKCLDANPWNDVRIIPVAIQNYTCEDDLTYDTYTIHDDDDHDDFFRMTLMKRTKRMILKLIGKNVI